MKKIKNKFIIITISLLVIILGSFFINNSSKKLDSKAILKSWWANILRDTKTIELEQKIPFILKVWDTVSTSSNDSLLVIKWWDNSITRLWPDSTIVINEANVYKDLSRINISFELLAWKSWSNVTSFFWEESYFHQTFEDNEAAVRWTTFNVDLEKEFVYVSSHEVNLTNKDWKTVKIWENKPFSLETFDFISLINFIKNYKDESWKKINSELDKIHIEELANLINEKFQATWEYLNLEEISIKINNIKDISLVDQVEKNEIYNDLLTQYQKIHFAQADSPDLLSLKLEIKEAMLWFASNTNKENLITSTVYDVEEVKKTNDPLQFQTIINIFSEHENILKELDIYFPDIINIENLSEDFNAVMQQEISKMKSLVSTENMDIIRNLKASDFDLNLSDKVQRGLDKHLPKAEIQWFLQKIIQWFNSLNK